MDLTAMFHASIPLAGMPARQRDAEFRDRHDLPTDDAVDEPRGVDWASAFARMADAATDHLDPTLDRTGRVGTRNLIVLHHDLDPDGALGPGALADGVQVPDTVARFLGCDAQVIVNLYLHGRLIGVTPTVREPPEPSAGRSNGAMVAAATHCTQRRWVHLHHLTHWEDGGLTTPSNLLSLCPAHHRGLHAGDFTVDGNPEDDDLVFRDRTGQVIRPPTLGPSAPPAGPGTYTPPDGARLTHAFSWN